MSSVLELTNIQQTVKFGQNNCLANMLNLPKHWQQFLLLECWPKPSAIHHEDPRCLLRQKTCREKRWTSNEAGRRATRPHRLVMTTAALSTVLHTRRHMACCMLVTPTQNTDQPGKKNMQHTVVMYEAHTHPFNGPLSGTTRVSRYQKGETNLDFTEAKDSEWQ